jgi:hypothetical protein
MIDVLVCLFLGASNALLERMVESERFDRRFAKIAKSTIKVNMLLIFLIRNNGLFEFITQIIQSL